MPRMGFDLRKLIAIVTKRSRENNRLFLKAEDSEMEKDRSLGIQKK